MKKYTIIFVLYIFFINFSFSQNKIWGNRTVETENFADTIQIEFIKNRIIIPVTIGGEKKKFLFDTGAPLMIKEEFRIANNYRILKKDIITDANDNRDSIEIVELPELEIGKIKFSNCTSVVPNNLDAFECIDVEGVIGSNILMDLIIKIDVQNKLLIITDKKDFFKKEKGHKTSFKTYKHNLPILSISPTKGIKEEVLFDTGDGEFYCISDKMTHLLDEKSLLSDKIMDQAVGSSTMGFLGFETDTLKHLLRLNDLQINGINFRNVYTETSTKSNSRIGADILNYGTVILDFINHKFIFKPYSNISKSDINLIKEPRNFSLIHDENGIIRVGLVWEKSNAYLAGLRKGFIVTHINGDKIENICDALLYPDPKIEQNKMLLKIIDFDNIERDIIIKK